MKKIEMLIMMFCGLFSTFVFVSFLSGLVYPEILDFLILSRWKIIYILAGSLMIYKLIQIETKRKMSKGENI